MNDDVDILVRNARLRGDQSTLVDLAIAEGRVAGIDRRLDCKGRFEIDAGGNLVTPSFVNPHLHLCKVWTLPMMSEDALGAYQGDDMKHALMRKESRHQAGIARQRHNNPENRRERWPGQFVGQPTMPLTSTIATH